MRRVVMGALVLAAVPWGAAQAYWIPYPSYGYDYAPQPAYVAPPYYPPPPYLPSPYAQPRYAPPSYAPPRYAQPRYVPGYDTPGYDTPTYRARGYGRVEARRIHRVPVRNVVRPRPVPTPAPSPFAGPGLEGVVPAAMGPRSPFTLVPAPVTPPPPQPAAPPNNAFPPESFTPFRGD